MFQVENEYWAFLVLVDDFCFWCLAVANIVIMSVFSPQAWKWKVLETGFKAWERSSSRDSKGKGDKWQQVWNQRWKWHLEGKRSWGKYKWQGKPEKPESYIQRRLRGNRLFVSSHLHDWLLLSREISYSIGHSCRISSPKCVLWKTSSMKYKSEHEK